MQSNRHVDGIDAYEMVGQRVLVHLALKGMGDNSCIGWIYVPPKTHPRQIWGPNSTLVHCTKHFAPRLSARLTSKRDLDIP